MKGRVFSINGIVLGMFLVFSITAVQAQRGNRDWNRRGDGYGRNYNKSIPNRYWSDQLELTDEQKEKIDEINLASSKEFTQRQNKINELEAQLTTTLTGDNVDKSKADKLIDEIGKLRAENRKERIADHLKIRELLTDKQKLIFDQHRSGRRPYYGRYFRR